MKKVLIVEDELSIADFLSDLVGMLGCESKKLTNGAKVLQIAKEWKPDLITLDIMMPPPDGVEVLSQLKADPLTQAIPVFVVSVVAAKKEFMSKFSKAQGVFSKPLDTKQFIAKIKEVCGPNI
jgi:CheY-like chemotaxis protein